MTTSFFFLSFLYSSSSSFFYPYFVTQLLETVQLTVAVLQTVVAVRIEGMK